MPTINQLSQLNQLSGSDQLPVYSASNGDARKASLSTLLAYVESQFASPDFQRVTASPTLAGFTVQLPSTANSLFLILTPTGTMATGTVVLPPASGAADGQQVVVYTSQEVTTLTLTPNGATAVYSGPTSIAAGGAFTLRFDRISNSWFCVEKNAEPGVSSGTFTPVYNGAGVVGTVTFSCRYQRTANVVTLELTIAVAEGASSFTWTTATDSFSGAPSVIIPSLNMTTGAFAIDNWAFSVFKISPDFWFAFSKATAPFFVLNGGQGLRSQVTYLI